MKKNLLLIFPHFSTDSFFKKQNREEWEILTIVDLAKKGALGAWRFLRHNSFEHFYIGRPDLQTVELKYYLEAIYTLTRAKKKRFVDNFDNEKKLSTGKFWFIETPKIIFEMVMNVFIVVGAYLWVIFVWALGKIPKHYADKNSSQKLQKIAFLRTDDFGSGPMAGGSFTHGAGFCEGAIHQDWKVVFIAAAPAWRDIRGTGETSFIKIPALKEWNTPEIPEILYGWKFLIQSYQALKKEKPSFLYHRHSSFHASTPVLARLLKIPLILEYNGSEAWVKEKWGRLFMRNLCYAFEKVALLAADRIAVVSDVLKDELITRGIPEKKVIVNPNGVNPNLFHPKVDGSKIRKKYGLENKMVIGFIGSFGPWHGVEVLAQAIKPVVQAFPHVHFLIMGDGSLRSSVETIISEDGVENAATLTGTIPHDESPQYLAACDIFASPHVPNVDGTRFFGSPTKLFEYMAMGKAIVASDLEQIGTILEDEKTALLVKPGDVHDFVKKVIRLIPDSELRQKLGENARKEVVQKYTWDQNARRIINAYENLITP